jgi:hypothetical protein
VIASIDRDRGYMELIDDGEGGIVATRARLRDRVVARLYADRIDRRLARGGSPEGSIAAALRGRVLTDPRTRRRLASGIDHAIAVATDDHAQFPSPVVVDRAAVREALPQLHELRVRIDSDPLPTVRAMARAHLLLTDGAGPLYNRDTAVGLRDTVEVVLSAFDSH